jgi:hypothetical protein
MKPLPVIRTGLPGKLARDQDAKHGSLVLSSRIAELDDARQGILEATNLLTQGQHLFLCRLRLYSFLPPSFTHHVAST